MKLSTFFGHLLAGIAISPSHGVLECGWQSSGSGDCSNVNDCCNLLGTCGTGDSREQFRLHVALFETISFETQILITSFYRLRR